ncbi:MAG TPA: type IV pilus secretin PilQ [Kofleriaceae bacterium]|jgi:type IV pilus assembly protein PilQ
MSPRPWIAVVVIAAAAAVAHADGKNEVRAVTFDEDAGITRVHVRGAEAPMFTAYKLDRPSRVVIDLPRAKLADALKGHESAATFTPSTWAVSTIAAQQLDDGTVRVIVTLARPGRYDVKTVDNEVTIVVTARDPAPKTASPEDLARMQAESERAKQLADQAEHARASAQQQADASRAEADAAKAEAERLRKTAAEQTAKADAAQRAADQVRQKNATSATDVAHAQQAAAKAQADADAARQAATVAQTEADRTRKAAEQAKQDALAEATRAKADAAQARAEATRAKTDAAQAKTVAAKQSADAAKQSADAAKLSADATRQRAEAEQTKQDAAKQTAAAEKALIAERAEAEQAKRDAEEARKEAEQARAEATRVGGALTAAKSDAATARDEAARAKADAAKAKTDAEQARMAAAADKQAAQKLLDDANGKLAALDKKSADAQQLEDHARAANAAALAREDAARLDAMQAQHERDVALAAVKQAQDARDRAAATDRARLAADAKTAEDRLAQAKHATDAAGAQRIAAEQAAAAAKTQLDKTRTTLASVEAQRTQAVADASDATRRRGEAEAAASDATRRRGEAEAAAQAAAKLRSDAEVAATDAAKRKTQSERDRDDAEAQRQAALAAARSAQLARDAADKQRQVAETAAQAAFAAKTSAERSLDELTTRRLDAERAAKDLEARAEAEAKQQATIAAAEAHKASARELDSAKVELAKLAADRKHAEDELVDRRKAVAQQQAESSRLETAATQARDSADREETRRADLAKRRSAEEHELEALDQQKAATQQSLADAQLKAKANADAQAKADAAKVQQQVAQTKSTKIAKIGSIDFKGGDTQQVDIAVGDDAVVTVGEVTPSHVELIVDHAELGAKLERTLDVSKFGGPVKAVSSFRDRKDPNRVRLVAELGQAATPTVDRDAGVVHWRFDQPTRHAMRTTNVPSPVVGGFGAASTPIAQQSVAQLPAQGSRRHIYHGAPVDIDFDNAPLNEALRIIQDVGHINIVIPDTINPKVTVKLSRVPWDEALEVILSSHNLWYRKDGTIYRIAERKTLDAEDEAEAARREASLKAEAPRPETVTLNYANADDLRLKLADLLSSKGHLQVDKRTNTLIINDVAGNRAEIAKLAIKLDTQTPEISIEARIVEADSTFSRSFGIQWGGNAAAGASGGNATGLTFPSSIGAAGGADDQTTNASGVSASPSDFAVNLPATVGTGEGGALGLSLGSIGGNLNINLRLSAAEDTGNVRIISSPKITVLSNHAAKISQGTSIPISVVSAAGTNTQFVQANLSLDVTPNVSYRDCAVGMDLKITNDQPDFVDTGARGDPTILTKTANTYMLVNDGETAVLGGIYTRNTGLSYNKVPFLGDIPVLGWLFKKRTETDNRTEILVFITPRIVNRANLTCGGAPSGNGG